MYFKFSHVIKGTKNQNVPEKFVPNKYQGEIVEEFIKVLEKEIKTCKLCKGSDETQTYLPYYDSIIEKKDKHLLTEVNTHPITRARVLKVTLMNSVWESPAESKEESKDGSAKEGVRSKAVSEVPKQNTSTSLIEYMPKKSHKSNILSDLQISNLVGCLPMYYR